MKKIETLFLRAHEVLYGTEVEKAALAKTRPGQLVEPIVRPGCEWALFEGRPTEKFDGSACAIINGIFYKRHEKKADHELRGWRHWSGAGLSGHGWLPVGDGPDDRWHREAYADDLPLGDGTYELVGPKVQKNPYGLMEHHLWKHGSKSAPGNDAFWDEFYSIHGDKFGLLKLLLEEFEIEGIVWHHADGRMVKIKRRDFGIPWPVKHNRPKVSDAHLDAMLEGSEPA